MIYHFEPFEFDDSDFRFSQDGKPVPLEPKALHLLLYLLENRNRLVRKQELLDGVWQESNVTENALTRVVGLLRKALNDDSRIPRFIETVPTLGYRFIAPVTVVGEKVREASAFEKLPHPEEPSPPVKVQPQATAQPVRSKPSNKWIVAGVSLLILILGAGTFHFLSRRHAPLTEKDTIVLADFTNATGDPVFDETLRQGLAVQLEQSPFLSLISEERIQQTLKLMGQPPDARLTPAVSREICERTAGMAVLDGSIAALGSQYVLGLRATNCSNGEVIAQEQAQAARKEDVLAALDQIASKLRSRVGESLTTIEKFDTPLAEATTPSLEALKAFSLGRKMLSEGGGTSSLPFLKRAVELDPNFAMAYSYISVVYGNHLEPERAAENIRKSYALRDKVSERERLSIEADYYVFGTGELEKAVSVYDLIQQTFPRDYMAYNSKGVIYRRIGDSEKALESSSEALRLAPNDTSVYQNLAADYVNLNRLAEADAIYKEAERRKLAYQGRIKSRYLLAFLNGDKGQMAELASSAMGRPGAENAMLGAQADTEAWYGKLKSSRELTRRAMNSAESNDANENGALYEVRLALFEVETGHQEQAPADLAAAMKLSADRSVQEMEALTLAREGDTAAAEKLSADLDKAFPLDTLVQRYWLPVIRAAVALQRKDPGKAVELLENASGVELAAPDLFPVYLRGEAYLMLHDGQKAAGEFQKFIDHWGLVRNAPQGALARLGLARAYAMQGDTAKARAAYQDFLTVWKGADAGIPLLEQAKAEYAQLR